MIAGLSGFLPIKYQLYAFQTKSDIEIDSSARSVGGAAINREIVERANNLSPKQCHRNVGAKLNIIVGGYTTAST